MTQVALSEDKCDGLELVSVNGTHGIYEFGFWEVKRESNDGKRLRYERSGNKRKR